MFLRSISFAAVAVVHAACISASAEPVPTGTTEFQQVPNSGEPGHPQLVSKPKLAWPENVPQTREARVMLRYTVLPDGRVAHIQALMASNPDFVQAAANSLAQWRYAPSPVATSNVEAQALFHAAQ